VATPEEQMITAGERASHEEDEADEDMPPEHPQVVAAHRRYIAELAASVREWVGSTADVRFAPMEGGSSLSIVPVRKGAASAWVVGERWVDIQVGDSNCRFKLDYTPEGAASGEELIRAVIAGRLVEVRALGRSAVILSSENGPPLVATGIEKFPIALLPLPGWRSWGRRTVFVPYES
jgi:hypothetical protein